MQSEQRDSALIDLQLKCPSCTRLNGFSIPRSSLATCLLRCGGCHSYLDHRKSVDDLDLSNVRPPKKARKKYEQPNAPVPPPPKQPKQSKETPPKNKTKKLFETSSHMLCKKEIAQNHETIDELSKKVDEIEKLLKLERLRAKQLDSHIKTLTREHNKELSCINTESAKLNRKVTKLTKQLSEKDSQTELSKKIYTRLQTRFESFKPPAWSFSKPSRYVGNSHYRVRLWEEKQMELRQSNKKGEEEKESSEEENAIDPDISVPQFYPIPPEENPTPAEAVYLQMESNEFAKFPMMQDQIFNAEDALVASKRLQCTPEREECFGFIETASRGQLDLLLTVDDLRTMMIKVAHIMPEQHFGVLHHQIKELKKIEMNGKDKDIKEYGICSFCHLPYWSRQEAKLHGRRCSAAMSMRFRFCPFCDDKSLHTAYSSTHMEHIRGHTMYRPWKCTHDGCSYEFHRFNRWKNHEESHRPVCKCRLCGKVFRLKKVWVAHLKKAHKIDLDAPPAPGVPPPPRLPPPVGPPPVGPPPGGPPTGPLLSGHPLSGHPLSGHALSGHPLSGHPLSGHPLSGHPLSGHPLSGHSPSGHPLRGHPTRGHPAAGHPPTEQPPIGHPPTEHPPTGHPPTEHPPTGHPSPGHPSPGHPSPGHSSSGHPSPGHPSPGHPSSGHPSSRHPPSGYPPSGHPPPGHPPPGHPSPGHPSPGHPPPGHPSPGHPPPGHPPPGHPSPGHPSPGHPSPGHPSPGHPSPGHPSPGHPSPGHPSHGHPPSAHPSSTHPPNAHPPNAHPPNAHPPSAHPPSTHPSSAHLASAHPPSGHPPSGFPPSVPVTNESQPQSSGPQPPLSGHQPSASSTSMPTITNIHPYGPQPPLTPPPKFVNRPQISGPSLVNQSSVDLAKESQLSLRTGLTAQFGAFDTAQALHHRKTAEHTQPSMSFDSLKTLVNTSASPTVPSVHPNPVHMQNNAPHQTQFSNAPMVSGFGQNSGPQSFGFGPPPSGATPPSAVQHPLPQMHQNTLSNLHNSFRGTNPAVAHVGSVGGLTNTTNTYQPQTLSNSGVVNIKPVNFRFP